MMIPAMMFSWIKDAPNGRLINILFLYDCLYTWSIAPGLILACMYICLVYILHTHMYVWWLCAYLWSRITRCIWPGVGSQRPSFVFMQDPNEPVLLFTKPLLPDKLAAAGIMPPSESSTPDVVPARSFNFRGRIGRGGRIVFDRWNPLMHAPTDNGDTLYVSPKPQHSSHH